MDLMYASEALSFSALRYQSPYGSGYSSNPSYSRTQDHGSSRYYHQQPQKKVTQKECEICKEKKRRSLLEYRRTKSKESNSSIPEDEEETYCSGNKSQFHKK